MSEEILARTRERGAAGEPALEDVFETSYRRLVVQLYGVVGDLVEAEDLVQEAFVRAAVSGRRFLEADNPEAWLRRTAVNLHRNRWRKLRNFSRIKHRLENPTDPPRLEDHVVVIDALRSLPEAQRQVLALYYLADLSVEDIATALGCAEGTVKSRLGGDARRWRWRWCRPRGVPMDDQLIREFAERAEATVELPDLAEILARGQQQRRRRRTVVTVVVAACLVVATGGGHPGEDRWRGPQQAAAVRHARCAPGPHRAGQAGRGRPRLHHRGPRPELLADDPRRPA